MKTIPLTAFALGIVASSMLSQPSFAFHDSALDPAIKQHLARAIEMLESRCASGGKSACLLKERIRTLGNDLARATQACRAGDQTACQTVARARNLQNSVQQGAATPNQQPGSVTRNPYDWRTYERGPIGNPRLLVTPPKTKREILLMATECRHVCEVATHGDVGPVIAWP